MNRLSTHAVVRGGGWLGRIAFGGGAVVRICSFALLLVGPLFSRAASIADFQSDAQELAAWTGREIGEAAARHAAASPLLPGHTKGIVGFEGVLSVLPLDSPSVRDLPLKALRPQELNQDEDLPFMGFLTYGQFQVVPGVDVGGKLGWTNSVRYDVGDSTVQYRDVLVYGMSVRARVLGSQDDGKGVPSVTLSAAWDGSKGELEHKDPYRAPVSGADFQGGTHSLTKWGVNAATLRVQVSEKLGWFMPYGGVGRSWLGGRADTAYRIQGTQAPGGPVDVLGSVGSKIGGHMDHWFAGLGLGPLNVSYMYSKDAKVLTAGVRYAR